MLMIILQHKGLVESPNKQSHYRAMNNLTDHEYCKESDGLVMPHNSGLVPD